MGVLYDGERVLLRHRYDTFKALAAETHDQTAGYFGLRDLCLFNVWASAVHWVRAHASRPDSEPTQW